MRIIRIPDMARLEGFNASIEHSAQYLRLLLSRSV